MSKTFGWKTQFDKGMDGETLFQSIYTGQSLTKSETREYDFDREDGKRVELKTDSYDIDKTKNFFIERWSVFEKKKPGSVWQSIDKADVFIYFFSKNKVWFEFPDIVALVAAVEDYVAEHEVPLVFVQNKGYNGAGYRIPRNVLAHLCKEGRCELEN
jgi:hypothetical protein